MLAVVSVEIDLERWEYAEDEDATVTDLADRAMEDGDRDTERDGNGRVKAVEVVILRSLMVRDEESSTWGPVLILMEPRTLVENLEGLGMSSCGKAILLGEIWRIVNILTPRRSGRSTNY